MVYTNKHITTKLINKIKRWKMLIKKIKQQQHEYEYAQDEQD